MTQRLPALQRAYLMGYRRAKAQARQEREELADMFFETLGEIHSELSGVRNEITRLHQIDAAIATEREPWTLLN